MVNLIKRTILYVILIVSLLSSIVSYNFHGNVEAETIIDNKIYSKVNIDDNFVEDSIMIVLNKEETFKFKEYSPVDFPDIGCVNVVNIMQNTEKLVKAQVNARNVNDWKLLEYYRENNMLIDQDNFRKVLRISLKEKSKENIVKSIGILMKMPEIITAEPDYIQYACADNNEGMIFNNQWALENVNIEGAWNKSTGTSSVIVGVIDSGIDSSHPALTNRIDYVHCMSFLNDFSNVFDSNPVDVHGHGSHVAGIIGAEKETDGIYGVCRDVRMASLRVFNSNRETIISRVARAVDYAIGNNIPILNYSGGGNTPYIILNEFVFGNYPGLLVCAAGNNTRNTDDNPYYPAHYTVESDRIISVGAINRNNTRATGWVQEDGSIKGSNYGATSVDLFAPGEDIKSTVPEFVNSSGYKSMLGTSMAAPFVTGVAALMKSYNPRLTAAQIKKIINDNVDYVEALDGLCKTNGKLNAQKALEATFQTKEIFNWSGYEGEDFYWRGKVNMYYDEDAVSVQSDTLVFTEDSIINFEVVTIDANNLVLAMSGSLLFRLLNKSSTLITSHHAHVDVNLASQASISDATFSIDTSTLEVGTYKIVLNSHFNRGPSYEEDHTYSYSFAVNRPIEVMNDFGYLSSWYQWKGNVELSNKYLYSYSKDSLNRYIINKNNTDLEFEIGTYLSFNAVKEMTGYVTMELVNSADETVEEHYCSVRVGLVSNVTLSNSVFIINTADYSNDTYTIYLYCSMTRNGTTYSNSASYSFVLNKPTSSGGACITEGSLITLADGTQTAVENLTGNEELLVWDMYNGVFSSAPILFIDSEELAEYDVINLEFSDGTNVEVIDEHAFFDLTLNKYVFLREDASQYIGHYFNKQTYDVSGNMVWIPVQLTNVTIEHQTTRVYSPVTYSHLCYYVNGMLSMPGNTESFINIFNVNPVTLMYDQESMQEDISTYGLYTYEEFNAIISIPEEVFNAFNGQYLKIAIGKGLTTLDEIQSLLDRYIVFFA